jgi:hypothetical protein
MQASNSPVPVQAVSSGGALVPVANAPIRGHGIRPDTPRPVTGSKTNDRSQRQRQITNDDRGGRKDRRGEHLDIVV